MPLDRVTVVLALLVALTSSNEARRGRRWSQVVAVRLAVPANVVAIWSQSSDLTPSSGAVAGPLSWGFGGAPRGIRTPNRQIRSLVLCVDLVGSRRIWPAQVGCLVDLVGSSRVPSDRVDDQTDDQAVRRGALGHQTSATTVGPAPDIPSGDSWRTGMRNCRGPD